MNKKKKVAVVVTHPIQYHVVIWRALAECEEFDLEVLYCSKKGVEEYYDKDFNRVVKWDIDLLSGYRHFFFENSRLARREGFFKYVNWGLINKIRKEKYDIVYFHGVNHFTHLVCFLVAKSTKAKIIVRNIAHLLDVDTHSFKEKVRKIIFSSLYKRGDYFLYIGENNKKFFNYFGISDQRLIYAPHVVNNKFFQQKKDSLETTLIRNSLGIYPGSIVYLFCAKLYEKKQPILAINAFHKSNISDAVLLMVGDGVLKDEVVALIEKLEWKNGKKVILTGFINQSKLPEVYIASNILLLPSKSETWGLVVNEAANFACPVIVSDKVGCAPEIKKEGIGLVFRHDSEEDLINAIEKLYLDSNLRRTYSQNISLIPNKWSVSLIVDAIKKLH